LFSYLWKRDSGLCYLCETSLADELTSVNNSIEIHHIIPFAEDSSNETSNLALTHKSCHESWHYEYSTKVSNKKNLYKKSAKI
jgi:5-methylcytosine-specific restriction endonuclease McrA